MLKLDMTADRLHDEAGFMVKPTTETKMGWTKGTTKPVALRLPHDLKEWVVSEAKRNGCSQNSEIVRCVRYRKEREEELRKAA